MRRGDIWLFDFEPSQGSEANKVRPAVVVSNDGANTAASRTGLGLVTAVPLTRTIEPLLDFHVLLDPADTGLRDFSKAQTEQMRSVSIRRAVRHVGGVPVSGMVAIDRALRLHLAL